MARSPSGTKEIIGEEMLDEKPSGVVFAKCPDGDRIILCDSGNVIRFSHQQPVDRGMD